MSHSLRDVAGEGAILYFKEVEEKGKCGTPLLSEASRGCEHGKELTGTHFSEIGKMLFYCTFGRRAAI